MVNTYFVYHINLWPFTAGKDFMLENSLLGAVKLTKYVDFVKYKYSHYSIGFDAH